MLPITLQEAKDFMKRTDDDEDDLISANIVAADSYIASAVGKEYDRENPRAKYVAKVIVANLTDDRAFSSDTARASNNTRWLISSILTQLRLELPENVP
jgi:uncharacterized phage protein (predicted DNA packaging)